MIYMAYNETPTEGAKMFKNRSLQVKVVNDKDAAPAVPTLPTVDFETIDKTVKEYAYKGVIGAVLAYAAVVTINTAANIIEHHATK